MATMVSPSLLAADFLHLDQEIDMINRSEADWLHLGLASLFWRLLPRSVRNRWTCTT